MAKARLSQMTLPQNYFLVLCVPVSPVKASQSSSLTHWPEAHLLLWRSDSNRPRTGTGPDPLCWYCGLLL